MATHQSVLTSTWTFSPLSKVATMWQTDSAAYKLKPSVKIVDGGLYFIFSFHLHFYFILFFIFLFLEQLGLGFISHAVTSVTN